MEREILFRGKSKDTGEWLYGDWLNYGDTAQIWYTTEEGKWNALVIPETRGQYTGLTDKNGKRIFEGDIIKYKGELLEVRYSNNQARFLTVFLTGVFVPDPTIIMTKGRVIGNIHDDRELLKEDNNA